MIAYTQDQKTIIFTDICNNVIENKLSFSKAIEASEISRASFYTWLIENEKFKELYNYAREIRADILFEEIVDISDTVEIGEKTKTTINGQEIYSGDMIEHRRLRVDSRKFAASRMNPKKYGDKIDMTTGGEKINQPLSIQIDGEQINLK